MTSPDDAVEAAARAIDPEAFGRRDDGTWLTDWTPGKRQMIEALGYQGRQRQALESARAALTAAAPLMRADERAANVSKVRREAGRAYDAGDIRISRRLEYTARTIEAVASRLAERSGA